jgi:hypothetical protein
MTEGSHKLCPSSDGKPGDSILGIVSSTGVVALLDAPIKIDKSLSGEIAKGRAPAKRFRFSGTCHKAGCGYWKDEQCGVAARLAQLDVVSPESFYINCQIRSGCRWFSQEGMKACQACPLVMTDVS